MSSALVFACDRPREDEHEADHGDEHEVAASARTAWVSVERPTDASLIELPARVVAAASSRSRLDAAFESTVVRAEVQVGDAVQAGDAIVELRVPVLLEAAAMLSGTNAQLGSHQARRDRLEDLRTKGLVGAGEVFDVESGIGRLSADRRLAIATLQAAGIDAEGRRELLRHGTIILRAPIAGVVAELDAVPGDVVAPGESLAQILGRGSARIEIAHSSALPPGVELTFEGLDGERFALDGTPVATAIEPGLGRTLAWYRPADGRELADGLRGRVLVGDDDASLLEVPRRALRLHEGKAYVARHPAQEGGEPEAVEVEVLRSAGSSALIRSEQLKLGDRVAADAATVLQLGRDPNAGEGHSH
ncbi:MAG: efflux RND transporter periplasmic adaptor subunit [Myxococcales bacterium]|nr:efflux RND transporter periplasmic adaptor subunit [Myxococcales bacterium]